MPNISQLRSKSGNPKLIDVKPKLDHNITIAGLLVTDAHSVQKKVKREEKGILKGLLVITKKISSGMVYIASGTEFPNAEAVDLLLYLIWYLEENNWERVLEIESLNRIAKEVFGVKRLGKNDILRLERLLTMWKFYGYYFPNSFVWQGKKVTAQFGVIENWKIIPQGRGKPSKIRITFDEDFIKICKETDWYRRPPWLEVKKLRREISKTLYLLALEYKPNEKAKSWNIYIDSDIKFWYRNTFNSLAKHLYPKLIIEGRLKPAIEEINKETNLRMKLYQTEEGNYAISVKEVAPPGSERIEIPFEKLSDEDKAILVAYVESVAKEKKIQNIWGFLHSMTSKQVRIWLRKAKKYFENDVRSDKETELIEKPRLLEILRDWGRKKLEGKNSLYKLYFGEDKILKAYESNKKIVFKCVDGIVAELLTRTYGKELKEVFHKEVIFEEIQ